MIELAVIALILGAALALALAVTLPLALTVTTLFAPRTAPAEALTVEVVRAHSEVGDAADAMSEAQQPRRPLFPLRLRHARA